MRKKPDIPRGAWRCKSTCSSPRSKGFGFRNSKTRSDPGGGHRRTSDRRRQGPHACEPASLLGRRTACNDSAACQDEPIAAPFLNSQDAPCPRDKIPGPYLLRTRATLNHRDAVSCILDAIVSEQGPRVVGSGCFIRGGRFRPCHKRRLFRRGRREGIGRTCDRDGGSLLQLVEPCRETSNFWGRRSRDGDCFSNLSSLATTSADSETGVAGKAAFFSSLSSLAAISANLEVEFLVDALAELIQTCSVLVLDLVEPVCQLCERGAGVARRGLPLFARALARDRR